MWSITTKQKLKEQNSSRLTEPKSGLAVTKGKGLGRVGGKGGRRGLKGIMISTHNIRGHGEGSIAQRRPVVPLLHLTMLMDCDYNGVCGGDLIMEGV